MKVRAYAGFLCYVVAFNFLGGCARLPHQPITDATKALDAAKKAGAENYAPSQLKAAKVSYDLAMKEIAEENRKLPFMRENRIIIEMLNNAARAAHGAQAAAERTKTRIKSESESLLVRSQTIADSVDSLLLEAVKWEKDVDSIRAALDSATAAIKDAKATLSAGDLLYAKEKSVAVSGKIDSIVKNTGGLIPPPPKKTPARKKRK